MFTFFNSKSLWIGFDLERMNQIRNILDNHNIPYKYKTKNHLASWNGKGTVRGTTGSFGNPTELLYQYEIFVYNKDMEQAQYLIK